MATIHPGSTRELEWGPLLLTFGFQHKFFKFSRKFVNPLEFYRLSDNMKYDFNPLCQINFTEKQPAYMHSIGEIRVLSRFFDPTQWKEGHAYIKLMLHGNCQTKLFCLSKYIDEILWGFMKF